MNYLKNKKALSTVLIVAIVVIVVVVVAVASALAFIWILPGSPKTQTYDLKGFTAVDVSSAFQVEVTKSSTYSVTVTANERYFDRVEVTTAGNTLKIGTKPGSVFGSLGGKAQIAMPSLDGVTFSGATHGTADGFNGSNSFTASLSGASSLQMTSFQIQDASFDVSGASHLTATGTAHNIMATVSGASKLDISGLTVNDANLNVSGASNAQVNLNGRLDAKADGASTIQYSGNPTLGNVSTSGASNITKK